MKWTLIQTKINYFENDVVSNTEPFFGNLSTHDTLEEAINERSKKTNPSYFIIIQTFQDEI